MRYSVNSEARSLMLDKLLQSEHESTGRDQDEANVVHVSDLITSLPQAWFRRHPEQMPPEMWGLRELSDQSKANMSLGVVGQEILRLLGYEREIPVVAQVPGTAIRIVGHVDGRHPVLGYPAEAKVTQAAYSGMPSAHYFEQLAAYAAMLGQAYGRLYLIHRMDRQSIFKVGKVWWTPDELDAWMDELYRRAKLLVNATEPPWGEEYGWIYDYDPFLRAMNPDGTRGAKYTGWFVPEL